MMMRCHVSVSMAGLSLAGVQSRGRWRPSSCTWVWSPSSSSCRMVRVMGMSMVGGEEGLQWQPVFRFDSNDLMAEAPYLRRNCEDLDWKTQASDLRDLAKLSLHISSFNNQTLVPKPEPKDDKESRGNGTGDTWFAAGIALAAALFQCNLRFHALAAEESLQKAEVAEAASRAPAWLTPALLAFPVVSYAVFSVYRSQVNPYAKVTDWMFGVAAVVIIANLVLISTIGVRLY